MSHLPVTAEDLYLYAMDLLDPAERTRITDFLPRSPEARAELASVRGDLAVFALATEAAEVPVAARQRFLKQVTREARKPLAAVEAAPAARLDGAATRSETSAALASVAAQDTYTPAAVPSDTSLPLRSYVEDKEPRRSFFSLFVPWAGWAVAAGLAVSTWTYYQRTSSMSDRVTFANANAARAEANAARALSTSAHAQAVLDTLRSSSSQRFLLTEATAKPAPSARVTYLAAAGSLVFQGNNLNPVPSGKTYELWLIPKGEGGQPIPAGTFQPDARGFASVILPELPKGTVAANFGITLEEEGGSQKPTLPILMAGAA